jgi:SAM-dependent methyltransferase
MEYQEHWENVYETKQPWEVSWTQEKPEISLRFIYSFQLPRSAPIIDVGGGDSRLANHLLQEGFKDIAVLDISARAIERAKSRLGRQAENIRWIVSDITGFRPEKTYTLWHDRATFNFLITEKQISDYLEIASGAVDQEVFVTRGTFSDMGPDKCSGLSVKKYDEKTLTNQLSESFEKIRCIKEDHIAPFNTKQNFLFCSFRRK